ncbi:flagellar biosynthesis protein FlhB [Zhaonella formicivorans]|uniref:flagellar biosynthesis protein FlhB n=1 Tax=Zhaonella formicivorans TaxID=2528593 RepID=UPI0010ED72F4|nr:flagellar biosynthesis protein FlhB [Zhaonella formicivorans]
MGQWELPVLDLQLFAEEKTEEATPQRRQEARKKGQVAKSADLNAALVLLALVVLLYALNGYFATELNNYLLYLWQNLDKTPLTEKRLAALFLYTLLFFFKIMAPVFLGAMLIGLGVNFAQVGFLFAPEAIRPKLENINPFSGLKRMFSKKALVELLKALLKITVVGTVTYSLIKNNYESLLFLIYMDVPQGFAQVSRLLFRISLNAVLIFLVIAVLDYLFQRYEFKESIKMSKQEVKEEFKQTEGDPQLKAKLREKQRQLAMHRMMQSIPQATVVITNPTHLAVALKYETGSPGAPTVVAKGAGAIAKKIVEKAREYQVPVVEEKPVARFLYQHVEIGQEIPAELYQAVAEILAMLYRAGKRF